MFDHVTIYVPDRDASERFFETVLIPLGIETTYRTNEFSEWEDFSVMGAGDGLPPEQVAEMQRLVEQALQQGAFGMSVGLTLVPSSFADTNELIALAESLGRHGRLYVQHARWWAGWHARALEGAPDMRSHQGAAAPHPGGVRRRTAARHL